MHQNFKGLRLLEGDPFLVRKLVRTLACVFALTSAAWAQEPEEEIEDASWTASAGVRLLNRLSTYGVDTGPEQTTVIGGAGLDHSSGFSAMFALVTAPGASAVWQRTDLSVGFDVDLDPTWSMGFELSRSWYASTSTSVFRSSPVSASISLDHDGEDVSFGATVDRYFGDSGATFFSIDISSFMDLDGIAFLPLAQLSFGSKQTTSGSLKRKMGNSPFTSSPSSTVTVSGITGLDLMLVTVIRLGNGWSSTITPGASYTPSELSTSDLRFSWSVGVRKAFAL